jgi:DNA-binding NarL/FixJ family response regulator
MRKPISVMIADDHALMIEGLTALLSAYADLRVVAQAANGREALRLACQEEPMVALLDVAMPELNGIDTARELSRRTPAVKTIMLSMHGGAQHVQQALAAGARGYLLKQSASTEVVSAVRAVAAGHTYLSREISAVLKGLRGFQKTGTLIDELSPRERQITQLVAEGKSSAAIGAALHLSPKTIDTYRSRLMQKLGLSDVAGLVKFAILHGLTSLE